MPLKIVEQLCKFFCDLTGWQLHGKAVLLRIDDTKHPALMNTIIKGTINDIKSGITATGPGGSQLLDSSFAIIHIDSSLILDGKNIEWLMVIPRHSGYGLYRLCCTWIAVYIYVLERSSPPHEIFWDDIHAICSMKLAR
jgi:hypothetical protein